MANVNKNGRRGPAAKLTVEQVRKMRAEHERKGTSFVELAERFGVSKLTIRDAVRGYGAYRDV